MAKQLDARRHRNRHTRRHYFRHKRNEIGSAGTRRRLAYSANCGNGCNQTHSSIKESEATIMADKALGVLIGIVGLAGIAVIVSKRSNTAAVLTSALNGFSTSIRAAVSPVTK
jgi:hypothetical protein